MARVIRNFKRKGTTSTEEYQIGSTEDYVRVTDPFSSATSQTLKSVFKNFKTNLVSYLKKNVLFGTTDNTDAGLVPAMTTATTAATSSGVSYLTSAGKWAVPVNTNTTYDVFTSTKNGLVPPPKTKNSKIYFLDGTGDWSTATGTTYSNYSENSTEGGLVSSSFTTGTASTASFLLSKSGKWLALPQVSASRAGLMSSTAYNKLNGYPSIGTSTVQYLRADGTWKPIPAATTDAAGLMPAADKSFINKAKAGFVLQDGVATGTESRSVTWSSVTSIVVYVKFATNAQSLPVCVSFTIPPKAIDNIGTHVLTTNWPSTNNGYIALRVRKGTSVAAINVLSAWNGTTDVINDAQMYVYTLAK